LVRRNRDEDQSALTLGAPHCFARPEQGARRAGGVHIPGDATEGNEREGMEMMSPHLQNRNAPSKNCTVPGCGGIMTLQRSQEVGSAALSSGGTWVCSNNPSHIEVVRPADE
jgi:hypothetical protein